MWKGPSERAGNVALGLLLSGIWGAEARLLRGSGPAAAPSARVSRLEQRVGQLALLRRFRVVRADPSDLRFEQRDALQQLVLRIGIERFAGKPARGVTADPGEIVLHACQDESPTACCQWGRALGLRAWQQGDRRIDDR